MTVHYIMTLTCDACRITAQTFDAPDAVVAYSLAFKAGWTRNYWSKTRHVCPACNGVVAAKVTT